MKKIVKSGKGREEMREFWSDVSECLRSIGKGRKVVLLGDMNDRVGCSEIAGVGK